MKTSEPITKEYVDDFLEKNKFIFLCGKYGAYYRIFKLERVRRGSYRYITTRALIFDSIAIQLLHPEYRVQPCSWTTLTTSYSEIRHAFPTVDDLVE